MRALSLFNVPTVFDSPFDSFFSELEKSERSFSPEWGLEDNEHFVKISVDLPGINKDDINIEVKENQLIISGERKVDKSNDKGANRYSYRSYGSFRRAFNLGHNLKTDEIEASYQNGVLEVAIPKAEEVKPKAIKVSDQPLKLLKN